MIEKVLRGGRWEKEEAKNVHLLFGMSSIFNTSFFS
jgi:hypothetical protein